MSYPADSRIRLRQAAELDRSLGGHRLDSMSMSAGWQHLVYVKSSPIEGMGLFARRNFATGETILLRQERPVTADNPLDARAGELERHCDWLEDGRQVYLGFPERHINHSCDANAFIRFVDGQSSVVALRPIRANEEITTHYALNLDRGEEWNCNCGSGLCLGVVPGSFFALPLDLQVEFSPLLAPWFTREHAAEYEAFLEASGLKDVTG